MAKQDIEDAYKAMIELGIIKLEGPELTQEEFNTIVLEYGITEPVFQRLIWDTRPGPMDETLLRGFMDKTQPEKMRALNLISKIVAPHIEKNPELYDKSLAKAYDSFGPEMLLGLVAQKPAGSELN